MTANTARLSLTVVWFDLVYRLCSCLGQFFRSAVFIVLEIFKIHALLQNNVFIIIVSLNSKIGPLWSDLSSGVSCVPVPTLDTLFLVWGKITKMSNQGHRSHFTISMWYPAKKMYEYHKILDINQKHYQITITNTNISNNTHTYTSAEK